MKKYLSILFTLALALCAAPTYADEDAVNAEQVTATWTAPLAPVTATGSVMTAESTTGQQFYLYNIEAGMFIDEVTPISSGGWGSEAGFTSTGVIATITYVDDASTVETAAQSYVPGYVITTTYGTLFFNESFMYMDGSVNSTGKKEADHWTERFFTITKTDDAEVNSYTIQNNARTTNLTETADYVGYDATAKDNNTIIDNLTADDTGIYWLLLSQTEYDQWLEACEELVNMRVYLNNAMVDAQELGIDIADAIIVYEDADATQDDIDEATATLAEAIQEAGTASGEVFDYGEKTYRKIGANLIANPDFSYGIACWTRETSAATVTDDTLDALSWDNWSVTEDDAYGYILKMIGTSGGSTSATSLTTAWSIDRSKTYYFSCWTKNVSGNNSTLDINIYANSQDADSSNKDHIEPLQFATDGTNVWTQQTLIFNVDDEYYSNDFSTTYTDAFSEAESLYALVRCAWLDDTNGSSFASFELCEVEELTVEEEDETSVIINPQFTVTDTDDSGFGWSTTSPGFGIQNTEGNDHTFTDAPSLTIPYYEAWNSVDGSLSDRSFWQTIKLAAGEYRLSADMVASRQDDVTYENVSGVYLYAGDAMTNVHTANGVPENISVDFAVEVEEGEETADVEIGVKLVSCDANWVAADNFTLTYLGDVETNELLDLKALIEDANDIYDESKEGAEDLQAAIEAAQAILDDVDSDAEALESAMSTLKDAMYLYQLKNGEAEILGTWVTTTPGTGDYAAHTTFTFTKDQSTIDEYYAGGNTFVPAETTILTQTITGLPVGSYTVEVYCQASTNKITTDNGLSSDVTAGESEVATINANGVKGAVTLEDTNGASYNGDDNTSDDDKVVLSDLTAHTLENVVVGEDGTMTITITVDVADCVNWVLVGTKTVTYTSSDVPSYEDLVAALEEAEPLVANVGEDAFQISTDDAAELTAAIEAAEELTEESSLSEIAAALTALTSAATAFEEGFDSFVLNEPEDGQVFNIIMMTEDTNVTGNALESIYDEAKTNGGKYDFQFTAEPNANLATQLYTFTPVEDVTNGYTVSFVASDGETYYFCAATEYDASYLADGIRATDGTNVTEDDALVIVVKATMTEGVWNLYNTERDNNLGLTSDGVSLASGSSSADLGLAEAPSTIEWTLSEDYGTLILPFVPTSDEIDGLTFWSTTAYEDEPTLALVEVDAADLEASVPYLVSGDAATYTFAVTARTFDTSATAGWLTGAYASTEVPTDSYVLQNGDEGLAFYTVTDSDPITLTPNHCYLTVSSTSDDETTDEDNADETTNAPAVIFFPNGNGTPTAITGVEANVADAEAVYDLSGRKVSQAQKGIYIKGGKKVVIK